MKARLQAWVEILGDLFWLRPALIVLGCILLAQFGVWLETAHVVGYDASSPNTNWGYSGGAEGARGLLSAIASSNIGVAGTTFSITIAALTLASGQMGPRLLRNFIRDARNQTVLGIFLGTFAYSLMVLRTVRTVEEDPFVPHLAITGALVLALVAVGTLVWFVHHIATSINIETVVDAVQQDLFKAIESRTLDAADAVRPSNEPTAAPSPPPEAVIFRPSIRTLWPIGRRRTASPSPCGSVPATTSPPASPSRCCPQASRTQTRPSQTRSPSGADPPRSRTLNTRSGN